ncbi:MAG: hypothetical protein ACYTAF_12675, partial [Planctomycetota bacterium]
LLIDRTTSTDPATGQTSNFQRVLYQEILPDGTVRLQNEVVKEDSDLHTNKTTITLYWSNGDSETLLYGIEDNAPVGSTSPDEVSDYKAAGEDLLAVPDSYEEIMTFAEALHIYLSGLFNGAVEVAIDVKPGANPNTINLGSNGKTPVAILSTAEFDATTIDPATVTLASAAVCLRGKGTPMTSLEDVNGDGLQDLVVHVDTSTFELTAADEEAVLEGKTFDGVLIRGTDTVRIVP